MIGDMITINEFRIRHISDWSIFPWIKTGCNGWKFTWLFFQFTRYEARDLDAYEDDDDDFPDHGAW